MQKPSGTFIVLEGADGSGKGTQFKLLTERLKAVGYDVEVFDFPQYENESSYFVRKYLNGDYGKATNISPYTSSLFYALDRYEASFNVRKALEQGKIVLSNRYVGSNMAHQGSKILNSVEQRSFFVWEDSLEYQLLNIPRPKLNIFLRVPAEISFELIAKKAARSYTDKSHDEHEKDINHLRNSIKTYDQLCEIFPNDFKAIECVKDGQLLSIPEINNHIWEIIKPILPPKPNKPGKSVTVNLAQEEPREAKKDKPENQLPEAPTRSVILERKISLYLASELARWLQVPDGLSLNWAGLNYEYFTPSGLNQKNLKRYNELMARLVTKRRSLDKKIKDLKLPKNIVLPTTPLSSLAKVKIVVGQDDISKVVSKLSAIGLPEFMFIAKDIDTEAKKTFGKKYKSTFTALDEPKLTGLNKIIKDISDSGTLLYSEDRSPVEIINYTPKNEFKLLNEIFYSSSSLSRSELDAKISGLTYQEKSDAITTAIDNNSYNCREHVKYNFDLTYERSIILQLEKVRADYGLKLQLPSPRHGYSVPRLIEDNKLTDDYLDCFDLSLELYSFLQAETKGNINAYGTLLGHKNSFELDCDLKYIYELKTKLVNENETRFFTMLAEKIAEVHPLIALTLTKPSASNTDRDKQRNRKNS